MANIVDQYMGDIEAKAFGSAELRRLALPTLDNPYVQLAGGRLHTLKIPDGHVVVVHSSGGEMNIRRGEDYAASVFHALLRQARSIGALPVATASVIDAQDTARDFITRVGGTYAALARQHDVAILNGELAIYGKMVNCACNIAATMLSIVRHDAQPIRELPGTFEHEGATFHIFDPAGKNVWLNSDGTGTKPLLACRLPKVENFEGVVDDVFAMQLDDWAKFGMSHRGSGPVAMCNLLSVNGEVPFAPMLARAERLARQMGFASVFQQEQVGDRLIGPHGEQNPFGISGNLVSVFDEQDLHQMPRPQEGDTLIAIKAKGGRSNGFTDRRNEMVRLFGEDWHTKPEASAFGEFLTKPSIVFYPVFVELLSQGLATAVFHMSGGAFRDKLGGVLAKHRLYAEIGIDPGAEQIYAPDPCEIQLASKFETRNAYAKFAMGNEGFVTTKDPAATIQRLRELGLQAKVIAILQQKTDIGGIKFRAFNGEIVDHTVPLAT